MTEEQKHILVGKTITAMDIADDKMALRFHVEGGDPIVARTDGDCCSHSWVEHVEGATAIIGSPVVSAHYIEMDADEKTEDTQIAHYGFKIATERGSCMIDYRNESNGYYGGSLVWPTADGKYDYYYGGVYGQNVSKQVWMPVTT